MWFFILGAEGSRAQRQDCHGGHTQQRYRSGFLLPGFLLDSNLGSAFYVHSLNQAFGTACCQVSKWPGSSQRGMLNHFTKGGEIASHSL